MLSVQSATKAFNNRTFIKKTTLSFQQGQTYAIIGESGSGKSTFLHMLAGLLAPTQGIIAVNNKDIHTLSPLQRAQQLGIVFQLPYLLKELSVSENIEIAGKIAHLSNDSIKNQTSLLLNEIGLAHIANEPVGILSGGQKQRVALARALITQPTFLLADEVTGSLDAQTSIHIIELILDLVKKWNMGFIVCTHNQTIAQKMGLVFELKDGILIQQEV